MGERVVGMDGADADMGSTTTTRETTAPCYPDKRHQGRATSKERRRSEVWVFPRAALGAALAIAWAALPLTAQNSIPDGGWERRASLPLPREEVVIGVVDGRLYAVGGIGDFCFVGCDTNEVYDPDTDTWTSRTPMPTPRTQAGGAVIDGILYVVGGRTLDVNLNTVLEAYDPRTDAWAAQAPLPARQHLFAAAATGGLLYVIGGIDSTGLLGKVVAYDPKTDRWTTKAPMPTPRELMAAGVVDDILYIVGGADCCGFVNTVEAYDPKTDTWTPKAPMPTPRAFLAVGVVDGILYAVGGGNDSGPVRTVEAYDPKTNTWISGVPLPSTRWALSAGVVGGTLYAVGGGDGSRIVSLNEAFTPFLTVTIDIKPGDPNNVINVKSAGTVVVAILSSENFDATTVDPASVTLAGAPVARRGFGAPMFSVAHVDGDGRLDLLLHFRTRDLQLAPADTEAVLRGTTFSGQRIRGVDSVRIVPSWVSSDKPDRGQDSRKH